MTSPSSEFDEAVIDLGYAMLRCFKAAADPVPTEPPPRVQGEFDALEDISNLAAVFSAPYLLVAAYASQYRTLPTIDALGAFGQTVANWSYSHQREPLWLLLYLLAKPNRDAKHTEDNLVLSLANDALPLELFDQWIEGQDVGSISGIGDRIEAAG